MVKVIRGSYFRVSLLVVVLCLPVFGQHQFVLTAAPEEIPEIAQRHGLTVIASVHKTSTANVYVVSSSPSADAATVQAEVKADLEVAGFEANQKIGLPELNGLTQPILDQSVSALLETLPGRTPILFFGATVPSNYVSQTATALVHSSDVQSTYNLTGSGVVVAIIDTGVDPNHPALAKVLVSGFDFTRNQAGIPSEFADLDPAYAAKLQQSVSALLEQSVSALLEQRNVTVLNYSTAAILNQSVSALLEGQVPHAFGHGTMVAGIVHLVAPNAKIMPLKAFSADGSSNISNILAAIYYAADHGAKVISMSFSMAQPSAGLQSAIEYANRKGVLCVASSGNDGLKIQVYPAAIGDVIGVASTTDLDQRSLFSNFGSGTVAVAAPGERIITTYPGGLYAAGWGTSFSTPMVAGGAALVLQAKPTSGPGDIQNALSNGKQISGGDLGSGRIDLKQAVQSLGINTPSSTSTSSTWSGYSHDD